MRIERDARTIFERREHRFEARLEAELRTATRTLPVRLLDLSRSGALAESRLPPVAGSAVTVVGDRLEVAARVVWVRGSRFGLAFVTPIGAMEMFLHLGRSREAA